MKKYIMFLFAVSISAASLSYAEPYKDAENRSGLASSQKWVLGVAGAALLATAPMTKQYVAQDVRKGIAVAGLFAFFSVTIYEESKKKNEKIAFQFDGGVPSLVFEKQF